MYIRDVRMIKYVLRGMDKILKYVYTRCQNDKICIEGIY